MPEVRLTPQQQAVVEDRGGTLLVSAAAGSGKTKVLVDRVMGRIVDEGKNINEFLIITFTNAAAAELRGKISKAITEQLARQPENRHLSRQLELLHLAQISTVHSFCGALIRQYGYLLEVSADYRILEDSQKEEMRSRVLEKLLEEAYMRAEPGFCLLTDTMGAGRNDEGLVKLVLDLHEKIQSQPDPARWLRRQQVHLENGTDLTKTAWGMLLLSDARQQLSWLISRYDWAIQAMTGDELLTPKYLPCYETQRNSLREMLSALDGPWDGIGPALAMEYPRVAVQKYPDLMFLESIKAVKSDGKKLLESLQKRFSRSEAELIEEHNRMAPAIEALLELIYQLNEGFSKEKRRKNLLDFSDQEHLAIRLLTHPENGRPTELAREVADRFVEIMVDEYQDSNRIQEMIFTAICAPGDTNRFLVGDVKQSIYGFRQAEPGLFLEKYKTFLPASKAGAGQNRKLVLSKNFRSRPEILEAVNHVFSNVMSEAVGDIIYGPEERLYDGLEHYPETGRTHVELHLLRMEKSEEEDVTKYQKEAQWAAYKIAAMLKEQMPIRDGDCLRPVQPGDIAVLFRNKDAISVYNRVLKRAGIPVASGGGEQLFEAPEVRVLVDLLKTLNNPHQDIPLLAVLCSPLFRFSNNHLAKIRGGSKAERFYDAMRACQEPWCVSALEQLETLREMAGELSADKLVWQLLHETGLLTAYSAMEGGKRRRENLLSIYTLARNAAGDGFLYLYQLLRILERAEKDRLAAATEVGNGVILTSMHGAKGLEYPVVFLGDLSRQFNMRDLSEQILFDPDQGIGVKMTDVENRVRYPGISHQALAVKKRRMLLSEELRILYVAMTRPKDYLFMLYTAAAPEKTLERLCAGAGDPAAPWACEKARCLGDWVLLAALSRVEAGELFSLCGRPEGQLQVSEHPWGVYVESLEEIQQPFGIVADGKAEDTVMEVPSPAQLVARLTWRNEHAAASQTPSKLTATQLKGRDKDQEAAEGARVQARVPQLRRPKFILEKRGLSATERGTAMHLFLQYADFSDCGDLNGVIGQLDRLCDQEFLTEQQAEAVVPEAIAALFTSPLGRRMLEAEQLIREFKFSLLEDAGRYYPDVDGEQVLLQGVVDAAILEEDGVTVIDFKTDRVTETSIMVRAEDYRPQLAVYKRALERILNKPVKEMVLYFLTAGKAVSL